MSGKEQYLHIIYAGNVFILSVCSILYSEEKYQQYQADQNLQYRCAACRGDCYQVSLNPIYILNVIHCNYVILAMFPFYILNVFILPMLIQAVFYSMIGYGH